MSKLVVISGDVGWQEFRLEGEALIGRGSECQVSIPQPWVSRRHARIIPAHDRYFIEDLGSPNGTLVNGRRARRSLLRHGDRIVVGRCEMAFVVGEGEVPAGPAAKLGQDGATIISTVDVRATAGAEEVTRAEQLRTQLKALQDVAETACGALEIDVLLERVTQQLLEVFPQADHAHALLLGQGPGGRDLQFSVARDPKRTGGVGMSQTLLGVATKEGKAVLAKDTSSDSRFAGAASIVEQSLRSMMCGPLIMGEAVLGAIQVDTASAKEPFTMDDLQLLATVSGQVAVAAENARLARDLVAQQRLAAVGETIASLAHCIKNVLNGLKGGGYILDVGIQKTDSEKVAKGWGMVKRNTDFMFSLVMEMLAYCKKEVAPRQTTDIGELLESTMLMVQESASHQGVRTSLQVKGSIPRVKIDPMGMKRVVLNLLTNAIEACSEGGSVQVVAEASQSHERLGITIEDDGPGIPSDIKERLFEPFFTTKGKQGTGLGLALVKKIVDEHGGRVEMESQPGQGTTFRLLLPMIVDETDTYLME